MVVTFSNLYIVITTLLGIVVLGEGVTALKLAGLTCILTGVVLLAHPPARYAVTREAASSDHRMSRFRALGIIAAYVIIVGSGLP
jgi:drug/metabolite transporter (DMT)-like permease